MITALSTTQFCSTSDASERPQTHSVPGTTQLNRALDMLKAVDPLGAQDGSFLQLRSRDPPQPIAEPFSSQARPSLGFRPPKSGLSAPKTPRFLRFGLQPTEYRSCSGLQLNSVARAGLAARIAWPRPPRLRAQSRCTSRPRRRSPFKLRNPRHLELEGGRNSVSERYLVLQDTFHTV